jgi:hypothetical protein
MRWVMAATLVCLIPQILFAEPWAFEPAIDVTSANADGAHKIFHHLDGTGRRNIAVTSYGVAVAWEDDRDGVPRVYFSYKDRQAGEFNADLQISGAGEAYEPVLLNLNDNRFVVAWEEEGQVYARLVEPTGQPPLGVPLKLSEKSGAQVSLTRDGGEVIALWSEREGRYGRIRLQRLGVGSDAAFQPGVSCPVDALLPMDEQLYPSAALSGERLVVAWEDRRLKHTIIMAAVEQKARSCRFSEPVRISEKPGKNNLPYGAGHGVSRVALAGFGEQKVFAVWEDKRDFRNGYDIWGATYSAEQGRFGKNEKVQDDFGGLAKQRHATVAGHPDGSLVVAWDDEREGNADVMLSWREAAAWSDDLPLPTAAGEGQQGHPSIAFDEKGNLHAIFVERDEIESPTRLKYTFGEKIE